MDNSPDTVGSTARIVVLVICAVLSLGLTLPGAALYATILDDWATDAHGFHGIEGAVGWILGVIAAGAIGAGLLFAGLFLRFLRWHLAPLASLALSIAGTGFIVATYFVFSDTQGSADSFEIILLQAVCIVMLLLVPLPPFLHWAMTKPMPAPVPPRAQP
jgi:hypothetical protein